MFQPQFTLNYAMVNAIAEAEGANQLGFSPLVPLTWLRKWTSKATPWTVSANTGLDGNPLSYEQVEKITVREPARDDHAPYVAIQAGVESTPEQAQEVINFLHTLHYIEDQTRSEKKLAFGPNLLLDLHSLVAERTVPLTQIGQWRTAKLVVRQDTGGEVVFTPPTPVELKYQLDDFFTWLNGQESADMPILIKAAICWAELSRIHPFALANGRVTRAFVRLLLGKNGFNLGRVLPYEQELLENRSKYYRVLVESVRSGDLSDWIEYYLVTWSTAAQALLEQMHSREIKTSLITAHRPMPLRERQVRLLEYLRKNKWVSIPDLREIFPEISDDTILRDLKDLMGKGLAKKRGKTKASRYAIKGGSW